MADEQMDNETLGTDESIALIEQFHESMNKRLKVVQDSEEKLRKEKEEMDALVSSTIKDDDIIKINVGYELIIGAKRSTLCLAEGSMFSNMFSGRWDDALTRDEENRVFIDEDPELIKTIVNFLRQKKREDPEKPFRFKSNVPEGKKEDFSSLLNYFGLTTFFYGASSLVISEAEVIQPHKNRVRISKSENNIQLTMKDTNVNEHHFLYLTPSLSLKDGDSWKVTVNFLPDGAWLLIGIIQNVGASQSSFSDGTCYGWTSTGWTSDSGGQGWFGGNCQHGHSGYTGFTQGDCLYFHITITKLSMHSVQKNRTFVVDIANHTSPMPTTYIHFNTCQSGTKVTVEALAKNELAAFQFDT